jgi:hypothetical protein
MYAYKGIPHAFPFVLDYTPESNTDSPIQIVSSRDSEYLFK